ncbi:MAG: hypothetical protein JNL81_10095 [Hyphomonadaceae bacterium]|nr:hypothetical protein [Hyphomonadaceae bacterium]
MLLGSTIRWVALSSFVLALGACASVGDFPTREERMRIPTSIRNGSVESLIERVDPNVDRIELTTAVQAAVAAAETCYPWPGLWLDASDRRSFYYARYDLMLRDWGAEMTSASQARMREFVDLGFLTPRDRPDIGPGVIEYTLTTDGAAYLRGSPYGALRPRFCPNSQRRVAELTDVQFGEFDCGTVHIRFTHVADAWPSWARTGAARQRADTTWAPPGVRMNGEITLGRQWFREDSVPSGIQNGSLRSLCLDAERRNVVGGDLNLNAP